MASIKCGHCNATHNSIDLVSQCAMWEAEAKAEYEAERYAERFWEEGPHGPQDDPIERALWAAEDARRELWAY